LSPPDAGARGVRSRRGAYAALVLLAIIWGGNWVVMKLALRHADPIVFNIERTWVAVIAVFAVLLWQRRPLLPESWIAVIVTGFFQTTVNFGATVMALKDGGAGRTAVLVFTMPFWTMLIAWPVLHERVRGTQWIAVAAALAGLTLVVEPWNWRGALAPKLWAVLSGFGWSAATITIKYFQRQKSFDMLNFLAWQMLVGILPICLLPLFMSLPATNWNAEYWMLLLYTGVVSTAMGFLLWLAVLRHLPAGTAALNMLAIPPIALVTSMVVFGEQLTANEWIGIVLIGIGLVIISLRAWRGTRRGESAVVEPAPLEGG
jgi:drug/metabolite transporter (DMT)-like permease